MKSLRANVVLLETDTGRVLRVLSETDIIDSIKMSLGDDHFYTQFF